MSCRQCHLVDDVTANVHTSIRTYSDFSRRSLIPDRGDGQLTTVRNSPALPDMSLDRDGAFFLHFDGEFESPEALVRGTFTGRNLGWLATEYALAVGHIASVIRADDGTFPLVASGASFSYEMLFAGSDPRIPEKFRISEDTRMDVMSASDDEILDAVAFYVSEYLRNIQFSRGWESDVYNGSPYDVFLANNGLPRAAADGESPSAYLQRLREALAGLGDPVWVDDVDQRYTQGDAPFVFGERELRGLKTFLATPADTEGASIEELRQGGIGNCAACHIPPVFSDYAMHNTGVSAVAYDQVWGEGAFNSLLIPGLEDRSAQPELWLPASPTHPTWLGTMRAISDKNRPGHTDLGVWSIYANEDHPQSQAGLEQMIRSVYDLPSDALASEVLDHSIALFKAPSIRDLAQSAPYLHDGSADTLGMVLKHYQSVSALQREGSLRNGDPRLAGIALLDSDMGDLQAFLDALRENYE
jgi:hypothetical protein